jgi:hypothetical protein
MKRYDQLAERNRIACMRIDDETNSAANFSAIPPEFRMIKFARLVETIEKNQWF